MVVVVTVVGDRSRSDGSVVKVVVVVVEIVVEVIEVVVKVSSTIGSDNRW